LSDTFTLITGNKTWKFGGEIRPEENTIYEPANPRGAMGFTTQFTDNAGDPGSGGSGLATLLTGQPNSGNINNLNNIDYFRHTYSLFAQNDWRITPKLNLNLGLRYEYFSPVYERFHRQASFNPKPATSTSRATAMSRCPPRCRTCPSITRRQMRSFPRITPTSPRALALLTRSLPKLTMQSAFGVFFNGDEDGPYSNPSPGFNPPYFDSQVYSVPCNLPSYNAAAQNCALSRPERFVAGVPGQCVERAQHAVALLPGYQPAHSVRHAVAFDVPIPAGSKHHAGGIVRGIQIKQGVPLPQPESGGAVGRSFRGIRSAQSVPVCRCIDLLS
jgi:hypothetical protein